MNSKCDSFCFKCKKITPAKEGSISVEKTKTGKFMMKSRCKPCDTKKSKFIPESDIKKGGFLFGLLGNLLKPLFG